MVKTTILLKDSLDCVTLKVLSAALNSFSSVNSFLNAQNSIKVENQFRLIIYTIYRLFLVLIHESYDLFTLLTG